MLNRALPWKRGTPAADDAAAAGAAPSSPDAPRRRRGGRAGRRGASDRETAVTRARRNRRERRRQLIAVIVGAALILTILAVVAVGVWQQYILPPRIMAGQVRDVRFTMGDLVERIRVLQGINRYEGGRVDFSRVPFQLLTDLLHAEILRQAAPGLDISVTEDDVEAEIRNRFRPEPAPGEEVDDAQLDAEYRSDYIGFLTQVNLDDDDYRRIVAERLQQRELFTRMLATLPAEAPQVELQAIGIGVNSDAVPEAVRERLQLGEDFAAVAREINGSDGSIGWVPEGAFPEFDPYLFGAVNEETGERSDPLLAPEEISDPIYADETIFLIRIAGGPETRAVEPPMQFQLAGALVQQWKDDQLAQGSEEGWVKINFDSNRYAWVTDQVRITAPRVTPPPPPGGSNPLQP